MSLEYLDEISQNTICVNMKANIDNKIIESDCEIASHDLSHIPARN